MTQSERLFCSLRQLWVAATPEECVRQALVYDLIHHLGYPAAHLAIEVHLSQLPHLKFSQLLPKRRADLVVFGRGNPSNHELIPLLLVECKAVSLSSKTMRQVWGYNYFVQAPLIAAVNQTTIRLEWQDPTTHVLHSSNALPPYAYLISHYL